MLFFLFFYFILFYVKQMKLLHALYTFCQKDNVIPSEMDLLLGNNSDFSFVAVVVFPNFSSGSRVCL